MPARHPVRRFLDTVREQPRLVLATAGTALAAVLAGGGLALALGGPRETGASPTPEATLAAATASASPTPSSTPSPTPSPTSEPRASTQPTASPTSSSTPVASATPHPTPSPTVAPPVDRSWTALPTMPNAGDYHLRDALLLDDGRLVAFRYPNERGGSVNAVTIRAGDRAWALVELEPALDDSVIYQWAQAGDGQIYAHDRVIDPSGNRWAVQPFNPGEGDAWSGAVAAGGDGRLYRLPLDQSHLAIVDVETGQSTHSAPNTVVDNVETILVGRDRLYLLAIDEYASYDPVADAWSERAPHPWMHASRAGLGPDGRIYMLASGEFGDRTLHAIDPATDRWTEVPRPIDAPSHWTEWNPIFLTGPDGRLWAVDARQSYAFVGD